jgi:hypothetical protein
MYEEARRMGYDVVESAYQTADGKALRSSMQKRMEAPADNDLDFTQSLSGPSFHGNSVGAAQGTGLSHDPGQSTTAFAKARLDIFAKLNKSTNSVIRALGFKMVKDPIQTDKYVAQGWTATERKRNTQRVVGGLFHRDARDAFNEAAKVRGMGPVKKMNFHREFYENVSKVARGDVDVIVANQDIAPQLQKAATAMRNVYDTMVEKMVKSGVQGAENLKGGGQYVNRVWNHNNIRKALATFGEKEVVRVLANAIQVPGLQGDVAKAKSFLTAVKKLEFNHTLPDLQLYAHDAVALRKELSAAGLQPHEVDSVVDVMFHQKKTEGDAGNAGNLKFRFDIDENHRETINGQDLKVSDLFENDSRVLVDKYLNSMAGHDAMAQQGFKSRADFMRDLATADEEHLANSSATTDASRFNEEKQLLLDMYHYTTGRPMSTQTFNRLDRSVGAFRAYTRSVMLGQLGVAASFEMFNAIGMTTTRAFMQQLPSFAGLIRQLRTGKLANAKLAQDIENMVGAGLESASSYARQHELTEFTYDRGLTQFEDGMNKASHVVDIISGNNHATSMTRQMAAAAFVQKHVNLADGKLKLTDKLRERLVGQGIDDELIEPVLADLSKYTTKAANGRVEEIHWENWQQQSPKTYDMYQLALQREVRDAIQDHDIGETMPWMHGTLGKIMAELRTFTYVAHAKQSLKNAHYRDSQALHTFMLTFMSNALAYSMQTSANYAHDQSKLQDKLSLDKIAKGAIQRMSIMGITPTIFETAHWLATGRSFFQGGTTNTDNRNALLTPSMIAAQRLLGGAKTSLNALNPFADTTTTQKEAKDLFSVLPGGNWYLMRNLNDAISSTFPKSEPKPAQ